MPTLHVVLVAYNNVAKTRQRWNRDILPALQITPIPWVRTVVDNSPCPSDQLQEEFGADYFHMDGKNLMYGPSINFAVARIPSDYVLYVCSQHGKMLHPEWINDLLNPMLADEQVGMTGWLMGSNSPEGVAHDTKCPWIAEKFRFVDEAGNGYVAQHIQGGVYAARTKCLLENPYPDEVNHLYTDHIVTWSLMKAGHKCVDVPTVKSVWRGMVWSDPRGNPTTYKYVHDTSEEVQ